MTVIIGAATQKIRAQWLSPGDGVRAAAKLWFEGESVYAENDRGARRYAPVDKAEFSARMPGLPRRITFDDGVIIVVDDNDFIDAAIGRRGVLYRLESHWRGILSYIAAAAFVVWLMVVYALPAATEVVAARVSQNALENISEDVYLQLKKGDFLRPSRLPPADRARLEKVFLRAVGEGEGGFRYRLRFHRMKYDIANAFAFPDGMVIASDKLIAILTEEELEAVFAHEISHVRRRHGLRAVMQSSAVFLVSSFLFGDISFILSTGPALLVQQRLSRDFEREADCDAYHYLRARGESEEIMAAALTKLEQDFEKTLGAAGPEMRDGQGEHQASEEDKQKERAEKGWLTVAAGDINEEWEQSAKMRDAAEKEERKKARDAAEKEDTAGGRALNLAWELLSTHPATRERIDFQNHCHD